PLGAPHRDVPAVRGGHVLDDRQAQARAAGGPGAGRVDAVEALEDAFLVLLGDADALVGDRDLHHGAAGPGDGPGRYADAGAGGRVVDGVLDEVAERGGELPPVAPDPQVVRAVRGCPVPGLTGSLTAAHVGGHGDLLGARGVPAALDGLGDQFGHPDGFGVVEGVVVL